MNSQVEDFTKITFKLSIMDMTKPSILMYSYYFDNFSHITSNN